MNLRDKRAWHDFVYNLLYPAILGSMLYDLFAFPKDQKLVYASQIIIVFIYSIDYLHLYNDLKLYDKFDSPHAGYFAVFAIIGDGMIALLFRVTFAALAYGRTGWATAALIGIF